MMLGFLLARAGVDVLVLEKHADFLRDFRGDTIHPSTLEVIYELGLLDEFLKLPHQKVHELVGHVGDLELVVADFRYLPTHSRSIVFMPQWDFLNFLSGKASEYPGFRLMMNAEVTELLEESGSVSGVRAKTQEGELKVRSVLVIGADGRHSIVRQRAGLKVLDLGAPMDVLWFRISRKPEDPPQTMGKFDAGKIFISLNRGDYWQCGYVIAKGQLEEIRSHGLEYFHQQIAKVAPYVSNRTNELKSWDDIKLLTVRVDRLEQWYRPGLLCIGDAAHAMSPVGGVGINLAIQDAVSAANILAVPLREKKVIVDHLRDVQRRREFPTRITQRIQVVVQSRVIAPILSSDKPFQAPLLIRLLAKVPFLRRVPARLVGIGVRPEHVQSPEAG
jgi:2-polyprenyl-6-methoxyphenol hydroxylase-like FAD-dependent oxidoreductase